MKICTIALAPVAVLVGMLTPVAWAGVLAIIAVPGVISIARRKAHWLLCL